MLVRSSAFDSRLWLLPLPLTLLVVLLRTVGHSWLHIVHRPLRPELLQHRCFGWLGLVLVFRWPRPFAI